MIRRLLLICSRLPMLAGSASRRTCGHARGSAAPLPVRPARPRQPAEAMLSHTDEYRLGAMIARELRDQNALLEDRSLRVIQSVGQRLASQSAMGGEFFTTWWSKTVDNSFACRAATCSFSPGDIASGRIGARAGDAHETAHITQHHIAAPDPQPEPADLTTAAAILGASCWERSAAARRRGCIPRHRTCRAAADQFLA